MGTLSLSPVTVSMQKMAKVAVTMPKQEGAPNSHSFAGVDHQTERQGNDDRSEPQIKRADI